MEFLNIDTIRLCNKWSAITDDLHTYLKYLRHAKNIKPTYLTSFTKQVMFYSF